LSNKNENQGERKAQPSDAPAAGRSDVDALGLEAVGDRRLISSALADRVMPHPGQATGFCIFKTMECDNIRPK
jgi:hypothetical protein